ncbi:MAG: hypothetical protein OWQ54_00390 [Sulfolobaceae archaeon]|nr:hypothetical protein [Sulfolobaceae archaeon]
MDSNTFEFKATLSVSGNVKVLSTVIADGHSCNPYFCFPKKWGNQCNTRVHKYYSSQFSNWSDLYC